MQTTAASSISHFFIWRRVHSLMGLWLVVYLIEHLIVNSQATLWLGENGIGFIRLVNLIQSIPYLQVIETVLIGVPILLHGGWGIRRALTAKLNSRKTDGSAPQLNRYGRNRAFTWQRITAWILVFGIVGHVLQMRFIEKPKEAEVNGKKSYFTKISFDEGLYTLSARLGVEIFSSGLIEDLDSNSYEAYFNLEEERVLQQRQRSEEERNWVHKLQSFSLKENEVVAVCPNPGTALLLMVRNTFKNPIFASLYTLFVLAAAFHAFNGFWTFLITWGVILSYRSQKAMIPFSIVGILFLSVLGLLAIWGSYWINLHS